MLFQSLNYVAQIPISSSPDQTGHRAPEPVSKISLNKLGKPLVKLRKKNTQKTALPYFW